MAEKRGGDFVWAPVAVFEDGRLSKMQLRVLLCLFRFYNPKSGAAVFPKRKTVAGYLGYAVDTVSRVTSQLEGLGWLSKVGDGGRSRSCSYRLNLVPDLARVTRAGVAGVCDKTLDSSDSKTPDSSSSLTPVGLAGGIEQSSEQSSEQTRGQASLAVPSRKKKRSRAKKQGVVQQQLAVAAEELVVEGVLNGVAWGDWLAYRRGRGLSAYRSDRILRKLSLLPLGEQRGCVDYSIEQGYAGLFPDRIKGRGDGGGSRQTVFWDALENGLE